MRKKISDVESYYQKIMIFSKQLRLKEEHGKCKVNFNPY